MPTSRVEVEFSEIHDLSVDILTLLGEEKFRHALVQAALAMSFGRVFCPRILTAGEETAFIENLFEFSAAYFAEGAIN